MSTAVTDQKPLSKEERIKQLVQSIRAIDQAIEPFRDQKRDIKKNYVENGWLDKTELKLLLKAYTFAKNGDFDLDKFVDMYKKVE